MGMFEFYWMKTFSPAISTAICFILSQRKIPIIQLRYFDSRRALESIALTYPVACNIRTMDNAILIILVEGFVTHFVLLTFLL